MTKAELIEAMVAQGNGLLTKKAASEMVDGVFEHIRKAIKKDGRFSYPGFGTWSIRTRKARKGRNPRSGEEITIKASRTVGFRPAKDMKQGL